MEKGDKRMDIYDGCPVMSSEFLPDHPDPQMGLMGDLVLAAFCVIMEINGVVECVKYRWGYGKLEDCKDYDFIHVKATEITGTSYEISNKYYGKNVWITF